MNPSDAPGSESPSMVRRQANRVAGARGIGPRFTASATSIGEPSGISGGWLDGELAPDLDGLRAVRCLHEHGPTVGVLEEELPVV